MFSIPGARLWALPLILGACSGAAIDGTLVDGLTNEPLGDVRIVAKATGADASMTCQAFETTTGADGSFKVDGACTGTAYALILSDETLWIPDLTEVPDGGATGLSLVAWRNSANEGVYGIRDGDYNPLRAHADIKSEQILNTEEKVKFPWPSVPGNVPVIKAGDHLVLVGTKTVAEYEVHPLIRSEARKFGNKDTWVTMEPWYYIGTRFKDDENFERVAVELDPAKVITKQSGDRAGKYIAGDAVPPGRYVVFGAKSRTVNIVDFGEAYTGEKDEAKPEEG